MQPCSSLDDRERMKACGGGTMNISGWGGRPSPAYRDLRTRMSIREVNSSRCSFSHFPIASLAWTVTHEEVFREPREWCAARSKSCKR